MAGPYTLSMRKLMSKVTLEINVKVKPDWRVKAGLWLIRIGARLMGIGNQVINFQPEVK